jgi:hypothetical protein
MTQQKDLRLSDENFFTNESSEGNNNVGLERDVDGRTDRTSHVVVTIASK